MNTDKIFAEAIANEYAPKNASKVLALKKLDRKAKRKANIFAYTFGTLMALVLGVGMCLSMGVGIVNDVNGLRGEGMREVCAGSDAYVIIMHMPGSMETVHRGDMDGGFAEEMRESLRGLTASALDAGIGKDRIILDPGIGFGKTFEQNTWILEHSSYFSDGFPVLSASSRKRVIAARFPDMDIDVASAEAACIAARSGADMVRVHNVAVTKAALDRCFNRG